MKILWNIVIHNQLIGTYIAIGDLSSVHLEVEHFALFIQGKLTN